MRRRSNRTPRSRTIALVLLACISAALVTARGQAVYRPPTPLGLDEYYPIPDGNSLTPEKIELGHRLFNDVRLSSDRRIACVSCHKPDRAFSDAAAVSKGVDGRAGPRNAPALVNRAYGRSFFWDGRVETLEEQVLQPILNPVEMNLTLGELTARLRSDRDYVKHFARVFREPPSARTAAAALASFIRAQRFGNSPYDRFQAGNQTAISPEALHGLALFRGRANCTSCHVGPTFTDEKLHNTGVSWGAPDRGRFAVTGKDEDLGAFKTPTLREVARTAPYMHDGSIGILDEVVDFYDRGGKRNANLDDEIKPLSLSAVEKRALVAFLRALSSTT